MIDNKLTKGGSNSIIISSQIYLTGMDKHSCIDIIKICDGISSKIITYDM